MTRGKGQPTKYTKEIGDNICVRISEGASLRKIAGEIGIELRTMFRWFREHEDFCHNYTRAKEEQAELFAEQIIDISDEKIERDANGRIDSGAVNHARLRVDARKWVASKLKPKKYGDSTTLRGDSEAPLNPSVNVILNK